ncbi:hypothetical protein F5Y18DRAFT_106941 [Xylariaceae sp. FL1019]|nr:hypothetical protein F5Y18DRAFT_106941 [Xylariaceae sp. FL1019]
MSLKGRCHHGYSFREPRASRYATLVLSPHKPHWALWRSCVLSYSLAFYIAVSGDSFSALFLHLLSRFPLRSVFWGHDRFGLPPSPCATSRGITRNRRCHRKGVEIDEGARLNRGRHRIQWPIVNRSAVQLAEARGLGRTFASKVGDAGSTTLDDIYVNQWTLFPLTASIVADV